ncbi:hypothetical protein [Desulfonema magnum]|uniref:hypothetical protein n=1 Tax=Desulfonema magnum TaxID=45655 RepID=UPI001A9BC533|nr:hypothetical protein [Desulfonema magnum]
MLKSYQKIYVLLTCLLGFAVLPLIFMNSAYAEKKLSCEDIKKLVNKEELKRRILADAEMFPLEEIAEDDKTEENQENGKFWTEKNSCCEKKRGCAWELGELLAEIIREEQNNDKSLLKVLTFTHNTLKQFVNANLATASATIYNKFIGTLKYKTIYNNKSYERINNIIDIKTFGNLRRDMSRRRMSRLVIERFSAFESQIREAIKTLSYIEDIVNKENLQQYIFEDKQLPFLATPEKGKIKEAVKEKWNEKAEELGNLLAEIASEIENENYPPSPNLKYYERLDKLIVLTNKIMLELERAEFFDAYGAVYRSFITKISSGFDNYDKLAKIIRKSEINERGTYWAETYKDAKVRFFELRFHILSIKLSDETMEKNDQENSVLPFFIALWTVILFGFAIELYLVDKKRSKLEEEVKKNSQIRPASIGVGKIEEWVRDLNKKLPPTLKINRLKEWVKDLDEAISKLKEKLSKEFITEKAINEFETIKQSFAEFEKNVRESSFPEDDNDIRAELNRLKNEKIRELQININDLRKLIRKKQQPISNVPELPNKITEDLEKKIGEIRREFDDLDPIKLKQDIKLKNRMTEIIRKEIIKILKDIKELKNKLSEPAEKVSDPPYYDSEIKELQNKLSDFQKQFEAVSKKEVAPSKEFILSAIIEMERGMLENNWSSFKKEHEEVVDFANRTRESGEISFYLKVLSERLPEFLGADPDDEQLFSSYNEIVLQLREYYPQMVKLPIIDKYVAGELDTEEWEGQRVLSNLRMWSQFLASLQNPREVKRLLDFKLEKWIGGEFLEIADKVLVRYYETKSDPIFLEQRHMTSEKLLLRYKSEERIGSLETLYQTVLEVLERGNVKPVKIILGKTYFESTRHSVHSTTNNICFPNGIIMGIHRNGFELDGRVIQKPQVIVNKLNGTVLTDTQNDQVQTDMASGLEQAAPNRSDKMKNDVISSAIIQMEQNILIDKWEFFKSENRELTELAMKVSLSEEKDFYIQNISPLPGLLSHNEELVSRCKKMLIPLNEYYPSLFILAAINEQQSDFASNPIKAGEPEKEISRLRNWTHLLISLQDFGKVQQFLDFDMKKWVREYFIEFADTFLCASQESQDKKHNNFPGEAHEIILRILSTGELEPVEIVLGKTLFDKKIHSARSTVSQNMTRDGVIVQVLRNGFREAPEGRMIQQPQVIYNKV